MIDSIIETYEEFNASLAKMPDWFQSIFGGHVSDMFINGGVKTLIVGFLGWSIASFFEYRHFSSIRKREEAHNHISLSTRNVHDHTDTDGVLLVGSVMVSHDFFRTLIIVIRKVIGGNVSLYERLAARGRREAIVRLKEEAELRGIKEVINIRFDTVKISARFLSGVAMTVYGTGLKDSR